MIEELAIDTDMNNILNKIDSRNQIVVTDELEQYINNCVIVVPEDYRRLEENFQLAAINRTKFQPIINALQNALQTDFHYQLPSIPINEALK